MNKMSIQSISASVVNKAESEGHDTQRNAIMKF
jgi:hypothetical protein